MATDPVCGMYVDERSAELRLRRDNRTYYFCASSCLAEFSDPDRAERSWRRRLAVSVAATVAIVVLQYGFPGPPAYAAAAVLGAVVQAVPGRIFYQGLLDALRSRVANMDVLIAVGTTAAYGYGLVDLLRPGALPSGVFFDAASLIVTLLFLGNFLERRTRRRAGSALRALEALLPTTVHRWDGASEIDVPLDAVAVGDRLVLRAGERVPADATVLEGTSAVDESLLTGESVPRPRGPGAALLAGALNGDARLLVTVDRLGPESFLGQIGTMLRDAESAHVPLQARADRIAAVFVPAVLLLAVAASLAWATLGGAGPAYAILIFVSITITACPCAFGLATPAALLVGSGTAAEEGILFRGGDSLERAARVRTVYLDKTGTVTEGHPALSELTCVAGEDELAVLALAAALESASDHPVARAFRAEALRRGAPRRTAVGASIEPGVGVRGRIGNVDYSLDRGDGAELPEPLAGTRRTAIARGTTIALLRRGGTPIALATFEDRIRPEAAAAIAELRRHGAAVELISGDAEPVVARVASELGIARYRAGLRPVEKRDEVRAARARGEVVAFVGDGVNDAPALAEADLGIALGTGTDVARQAGNLLLVRPDLRLVPRALRLADRTVRKVGQNLGWAVGYNAVLLPIAAGALVPFLGLSIYGVLPELGAVAMGLSSTGVLLNSISLRRA